MIYCFPAPELTKINQKSTFLNFSERPKIDQNCFKRAVGVTKPNFRNLRQFLRELWPVYTSKNVYPKNGAVDFWPQIVLLCSAPELTKINQKLTVLIFFGLAKNRSESIQMGTRSYTPSSTKPSRFFWILIFSKFSLILGRENWIFSATRFYPYLTHKIVSRTKECKLWFGFS